MASRMLIFYDAPDSQVAQLANAVELHLSELHDGLRTEKSLRLLLAKYHSQHTLQWVETPLARAVFATSTRSNFVPVPFQLFQSQLWHNEPAKEPV